MSDGEHVEYALCWSTIEVGGGSVNLPGQRWSLQLLRPTQRRFEQFDTIVEALLPHPINLNTTSQDVLAAVVEGVRSQELHVIDLSTGRTSVLMQGAFVGQPLWDPASNSVMVDMATSCGECCLNPSRTADGRFLIRYMQILVSSR